MKRKIWLLGFICICLFLEACTDRKENHNSEEITLVQGNKEFLQQESLEEIYPETENMNKELESVFSEEGEQAASENPEMTDVTEEITYVAEDYGEIQPYGSEFYYDEDTKGFSYNLEMFYLNSEFLYTMNDTLEEFYDGYLKQYRETEDWYMEQGKSEFPDERTPYSELIFLGVQYVDNDYISLLFNDVSYMGGAHPYSMFDAITIDRCTGKEVKATEILRESDTEILEKISDLMGHDEVADWNDIDFYLQEDTIVFFYRMPGYWEDVVLGR